MLKLVLLVSLKIAFGYERPLQNKDLRIALEKITKLTETPL